MSGPKDMSSSPQSADPSHATVSEEQVPTGRAEAARSLPPVEPPNASFLLQLFLIPLLIVMIIVAVWLSFSWLAHLGSDPKTLVTDLKRLNQSSWQKAMTLADLMRNPEHDHLKDDEALASDLATFLVTQIEAGSLEKNNVKMRMFLCRILGEFRTPVVIEALRLATVTDRDAGQPDGIEINVRLAAMEALALLAGNVGGEAVRQQPGAVEALLACSQTPADEADPSRRQNNRAVEDSGQPVDRLDLQTPRAELRAVAAYALGMVGGSAALDRLAFMAENDVYVNARYNAATGLCRHGDERAVAALVEMLDPSNDEAVQDEAGAAEREWKRVMVVNNAVRAVKQLHQRNKQLDLTPLVTQLEKLQAAPFRGLATTEIKDLLRELKGR